MLNPTLDRDLLAELRPIFGKAAKTAAKAVTDPAKFDRIITEAIVIGAYRVKAKSIHQVNDGREYNNAASITLSGKGLPDVEVAVEYDVAPDGTPLVDTASVIFAVFVDRYIDPMSAGVDPIGLAESILGRALAGTKVVVTKAQNGGHWSYGDHPKIGGHSEAGEDIIIHAFPEIGGIDSPLGSAIREIKGFLVQ